MPRELAAELAPDLDAGAALVGGRPARAAGVPARPARGRHDAARPRRGDRAPCLTDAMRPAAALAALAILLAGCGGGHGSGNTIEAPAGDRAPARAPARTDAAAMAARAGVPVLCWHQIRPITGADGAQARPYIVGPRALAAQLDALAARRLPRRSAPTRSSRTSRAAPGCPPSPCCSPSTTRRRARSRARCRCCARHHFTATFFVMTVVLGKPGWMTRADVRTLDRAGMTIGAHTWDHHPVPQYSGADWAKQIDAAHARARADRRASRRRLRLPVRPLERVGVPAPARRAAGRRVPARRQARPRAPALHAAAHHRAPGERRRAAAPDARGFLIMVRLLGLAAVLLALGAGRGARRGDHAAAAVGRQAAEGRRVLAPGLSGGAVGAAPADRRLPRLRRPVDDAGSSSSTRAPRSRSRASFRPAVRPALPDPPHERPAPRRRRHPVVLVPAGGPVAVRRWQRHGQLVDARLRARGRHQPPREPLRGLRPEPRPGDAPLLRPLASTGAGWSRARAIGAFRSVGWGWGGSWTGDTKDYMHFSSTGH